MPWQEHSVPGVSTSVGQDHIFNSRPSQFVANGKFKMVRMPATSHRVPTSAVLRMCHASARSSVQVVDAVACCMKVCRHACSSYLCLHHMQ